jgi:hypothetical protein
VFWPVLVIFYIVIILWVLMFLVKINRAAVAVPEYTQENIPFILTHDTPLVFTRETPFVLSRNKENSELNKMEIKAPGNMFAATEKAASPEIKYKEAPISSYGKRNGKPSKEFRQENINIANVTRDLIGVIMKMPEEEKRFLLLEKSSNFQHMSDQNQPQNIATYLVDWIMNMSIEDRCRLLGEIKSKQGLSRREFARKGYVTPVYFAVKGILQNGFTKNISNNGLLIETLKDMGRKFILGDSITINFAHPLGLNEIKIQGKIVRMTRSAIAVCFNSQI